MVSCVADSEAGQSCHTWFFHVACTCQKGGEGKYAPVSWAKMDSYHSRPHTALASAP